jgi:O-antigen/teichoic acid export membrane protein
LGLIKRQGIKNIIITYTGVLIGAVNMIFIQPRLLTEEELGLTRILYSSAALIGLLLPMGLPNVIVRYFPYIRNAKDRHYGFGGLVLLIFLLGFMVCAAALLFMRPAIENIYSQNSPLFVRYFMFLLPFTFVVGAISVATAYSQTLFKSTVPSFLNDVCVRLGMTLITVMYFNKWLTLDGYVSSLIGIYALELLVLLIFILAVDRLSLKIKGQIFSFVSPGAMLRFGAVMCVAAFASYGLRMVDGVILGETSLALVGVYTTAVFIASFIEVPLGALERISHTRIADHFSRNELVPIGRIYRESVNYLLLAGGFLYIGISACTEHVYEIARLPESYAACVDVVYIVGLGALVNVSTGVNSAIVFYSRYYLGGTLLMVLALVITVLLNLWLIPIYGIYGAAIASLTGAVLYNLSKFLMIWYRFGFQPYSARSVGIFLLILFCALLSHFLPSVRGLPLASLFIKGAVGCGTYLALLHVLKLAPGELAMVRQQILQRLGR